MTTLAGNRRYRLAACLRNATADSFAPNEPLNLNRTLPRVIREGTTMTDAGPSSQWPEDGSSPSSSPAADELESLREETKRLRQLVVQLSRIAIRNAVNMK
jgi:hypothetical protein